MNDTYTRLNKLLDAVVAGNATSDDFKASCSELKGYHGRAYEAYQEDCISAARDVHDAVLGGWSVWYETSIGVSVKPLNAKIWQEPFPFSTNPARSWLIAILKALIAQTPKPS